MSSIYHNHITDHTRTPEQTTQCVGWGKGREGLQGRERETANQVIAIGTSDSEEGGGSAEWW